MRCERCNREIRRGEVVVYASGHGDDWANDITAPMVCYQCAGVAVTQLMDAEAEMRAHEDEIRQLPR